MVFLLVRAQVLQERLGLWGWCEPRKSSEDLTTSDCVDIKVVAEDSVICSGHGERDFGESRIKGFNPNDLILLVKQAERTEDAVDFHDRVGGPNTDVVTMLIGETGTLCAELDVHAVAIPDILEQFT